MAFDPPNKNKVLRKLGRKFVEEGLDEGWFTDEWATSATRYVERNSPPKVHWLQIAAWLATVVSVLMAVFLAAGGPN